MFTYGRASPSMELARTCLEYCRFAYKAYAQSCELPMDPFYESWGPGFIMANLRATARERVMEHIHDRMGTPKGDDRRKFDPVRYLLTRTPNPHKGVVYRGGIDNEYILFQPRALDLQIKHAQGFDLDGKEVDKGLTLDGNGHLRCGYFQGQTGMTQNHPTSGWTSYLGAVVYDPAKQSAVIVFRGSRSGDGARALVGAQLKSKGSPDWVTDMNHLKGMTVPEFGDSTLSVGFYKAYMSCVTSLVAAFKYARGSGGGLKSIYITGHSLGGALAQNAFLDLTCGRLMLRLGCDRPEVHRSCYPISAPPICHGRESQHYLSLHAGASSIHHYYNPKDMVHGCDLVESTSMGLDGATYITSKAHPLTTPYHLGSQTALECTEGFPDAHEPEHVWRGMHNGQSDPGFWPKFHLVIGKDKPIVQGLSYTMLPAFKQALRESCSQEACLRRAGDWHAVINNDSLKTKAGALNLAMWQGGFRKKEEWPSLRQQLFELIKNPDKHSASSSSAYTLLLGLAVHEMSEGSHGNAVLQSANAIARALRQNDVDEAIPEEPVASPLKGPMGRQRRQGPPNQV